ncbi:hypothetical protein KEM60_01026 [Austwickia sp. TVS 96-490-7B]|uniref:zinc-dependent metalloprotease n=1 Tax=Austwickia sp. TVS 96-490-7B TaxID=2830843 RepID=UPI001C57D030|nr:zinc-dependent metalloprotease [Austwickia sp. TVS 96-490-7B]MBW3084837.1 hypothetical protein [Austwickia sp. TVS 96-490-7B]
MSDQPVSRCDQDTDLTCWVDWSLAAAGARALTPAGPRLRPAEARDVVAGLRDASRRASQPVADATRLACSDEGSPALVVDRATWAQINIDSFRVLLDPVVDEAVRRNGRAAPHRVTRVVGSSATGSEVAVLMSILATRVLGQYDLAYGTDRPGQLLLVAPNIVQVERQLDLKPTDFRQWVCLHEETHRVQFTAVPWLREHLVQQTRQIAVDLLPHGRHMRERLSALVAGLDHVRRADSAGVAELMMSPGQRDAVDRLRAVMALLEGHADVIMDEVGPAVVPSVAQIRSRFDQRRHSITGLDLWWRRLVGLEAKMAQYRDGADFVRQVISSVGIDDFNAVWTDPQHLPTPQEIAAPQLWIRRIHG